MEEERIYRLKNGKELVLLTHLKYEGVRYLLLGDENKDDVEIATEENNQLLIIDKKNPYYSDLLLMLFKKFKENE